jgi:PhnB protein
MTISIRSTTMTKPIPEGFHTVTPVFLFKDSRKAIEFYKKAFGATEQYVMPGPEGKGVMHASLKIGDSRVMLGDEHPDCPHKSAETLGGSPIALYLYVKDVDAAFQRAVDAGGTSKMPVGDMFWGDRAGTLSDPFGYSWTLATHVKDLSPDEIRRGAEEAFASIAKG